MKKTKGKLNNLIKLLICISLFVAFSLLNGCNQVDSGIISENNANDIYLAYQTVLNYYEEKSNLLSTSTRALNNGYEIVVVSVDKVEKFSLNKKLEIIESETLSELNGTNTNFNVNDYFDKAVSLSGLNYSEILVADFSTQNYMGYQVVVANLKTDEIEYLYIFDKYDLSVYSSTINFLYDNYGENSSYISTKKAKEIALKLIDVNEDSVSNFKVSNGMKNEKRMINCRFKYKNCDYTISIDAVTGKVDSFEKQAISKDLIPSTVKSKITKEQAVEIAINFLKIDYNRCENESVKIGYEQGGFVYEVEVEYNGKEHEVKIDSETGNVVDCDIEYNNIPTFSHDYASKSEVLNFVEQTEGENVLITEIKLDTEKNNYVYYVSLKKEKVEIELVLNAKDLKIVERKVSEIKVNAPQASQPITRLIGEDRALEIAIKQVGVTKKQVKVNRIKLYSDSEDYYVVEFFVSSYKYTFTIDAYSGKILNHNSMMK